MAVLVRVKQAQSTSYREYYCSKFCAGCKGYGWKPRGSGMICYCRYCSSVKSQFTLSVDARNINEKYNNPIRNAMENLDQ